MDVTRWETTIAKSESTVHFENVANKVMNVFIKGTQFDFQDAVGLAGTFSMGKPIGRNNNRWNDLEDFSKDWQVNPTAGDEVLFRNPVGPQHPTPCNIAPAKPARRLGEDKELAQKAYAACASKENVEGCMSDVIMSGMVELAAGW